jgi:hypothetical protein
MLAFQKGYHLLIQEIDYLKSAYSEDLLEIAIVYSLITVFLA